MKYLAKNLKWLRQRKGLKQLQLKTVIGFNATTWNNYEKSVSKPGLDDLIKIARFFNCTETDLLHRDLENIKRRSARPKEEEHDELNVMQEEQVEYKKLCDLKDQIIAAQQGEIDVLTVLVGQQDEEVSVAVDDKD